MIGCPILKRSTRAMHEHLSCDTEMAIKTYFVYITYPEMSIRGENLTYYYVYEVSQAMHLFLQTTSDM